MGEQHQCSFVPKAERFVALLLKEDYGNSVQEKSFQASLACLVVCMVLAEERMLTIPFADFFGAGSPLVSWIESWIWRGCEVHSRVTGAVVECGLREAEMAFAADCGWNAHCVRV